MAVGGKPALRASVTKGVNRNNLSTKQKKIATNLVNKGMLKANKNGDLSFTAKGKQAITKDTF
ncbi:hypothetical protein LX64_04162 [Chitinophaga skermanii]|uniref:Uncharacterized protein n=1 Tax=Chitinophaga skermanii TaxID=331697 RepID=A0A327Q789_9BACT|nr:hypothetical protein [Chitinophaga skermanii]RAJ00456.1 hypothetical protein LX64_04162 [Chitinophaga skermanii]